MILGPPPEGRGLSHSRTRIIFNTFTKLSTRAVIVVVFDTEKISDQIEKEITVSSFSCFFYESVVQFPYNLSTRAVIVVVFDTEKISDQIEKEITVSSFSCFFYESVVQFPYNLSTRAVIVVVFDTEKISDRHS